MAGKHGIRLPQIAVQGHLERLHCEVVNGIWRILGATDAIASRGHWQSFATLGVGGARFGGGCGRVRVLIVLGQVLVILVQFLLHRALRVKKKEHF